jgi:disulfide bond formation protein DsbB
MFELINKLKPRIWFLLAGLSCFSMLGIGAYLQFVENLEPCPLCISQRIALLLLGIVFLAAAIHNPRQQGIKIYSIAGAVTALAGGSISTRHIWIQHLPPNEVPECGPGLSYVFENFPLTETLKLMLSGTGDCAKVDWTLLGLSIPEWTLMAFLGLAALSLLQMWNQADLA